MNVSDAIDDGDACSLHYMTWFFEEGKTLNADRRKVYNVADPQESNDAVNKKYVDAKFMLSTEKVDSANKRVINTEDAENPTDGISKHYAHKSYLGKGVELNMQKSNIANAGLPVDKDDGVTKAYLGGGFLKKNVDIDAGQVNILNAATPVTDSEFVTRGYADLTYAKKGETVSDNIVFSDVPQNSEVVSTDYVIECFGEKTLLTDARNKKIINVAPGVEDTDAVTMLQFAEMLKRREEEYDVDKLVDLFPWNCFANNEMETVVTNTHMRIATVQYYPRKTTKTIDLQTTPSDNLTVGEFQGYQTLLFKSGGHLIGSGCVTHNSTTDMSLSVFIVFKMNTILPNANKNVLFSEEPYSGKPGSRFISYGGESGSPLLCVGGIKDTNGSQARKVYHTKTNTPNRWVALSVQWTSGGKVTIIVNGEEITKTRDINGVDSSESQDVLYEGYDKAIPPTSKYVIGEDLDAEILFCGVRSSDAGNIMTPQAIDAALREKHKLVCDSLSIN